MDTSGQLEQHMLQFVLQALHFYHTINTYIYFSEMLCNFVKTPNISSADLGLLQNYTVFQKTITEVS